MKRLAALVSLICISMLTHAQDSGEDEIVTEVFLAYNFGNSFTGKSRSPSNEYYNDCALDYEFDYSGSGVINPRIRIKSAKYFYFEFEFLYERWTEDFVQEPTPPSQGSGCFLCFSGPRCDGTKAYELESSNLYRAGAVTLGLRKTFTNPDVKDLSATIYGGAGFALGKMTQDGRRRQVGNSTWIELEEEKDVFESNFTLGLSVGTRIGGFIEYNYGYRSGFMFGAFYRFE